METEKPSYQKLMDEQDWESILLWVADYAKKYSSMIPSAKNREEYIFRAIEKVLTQDQAWNPDQRSLKAHLAWVLKSVISNDRNLKEHALRTSSVRTAEGDLVNPIDLVEDPSSTQDIELESKLQVSSLKTAFKDDPEAQNVIAAFEMGADKPKEVRELTGYSTDVVNNALRRIRRKRVEG